MSNEVRYIATAGTEDLDRVRGVLDDARSWLQRAGIPQWQAPFDTVKLARAIEDERVVLALDKNLDLLGSLQLTFEHERLWDDIPGSGAYVHRLVVARHATGKGVAAALLDWAQERSAQRGLTRLRLDCAAYNEKLNLHYDTLGFMKVGVGHVKRAVDQQLVLVNLRERVVTGRD